MFWCWAGLGVWRLHFPSCHPRGWPSGMRSVPSESHLGSSSHAGSGIALMKLRPTRSPSLPLTTVLSPCSVLAVTVTPGQRHSEMWQPGCRGTQSCFSLWMPAPPGTKCLSSSFSGVYFPTCCPFGGWYCRRSLPLPKGALGEMHLTAPAFLSYFQKE